MINYEEKIERKLDDLKKQKEEKLNELKGDSENKKKLIELGRISEHIKFLEELKES